MSTVFSKWGLSKEVLSSVTELGFTEATLVQKACIPFLLENNRDLLALARTGTGKTAAFGLPLAEKLTADPTIQALVLCPTRELANQVAQHLTLFGKGKNLKVCTVLGGESYGKQLKDLRNGPQIVVSTPGRLIDLMDRKVVNMKSIRYLILDEADEMLSFGFQEALETIWTSLKNQEVNTWLFSATMSASIKRLTTKYLKNPFEVTLNQEGPSIKVESFAAVVFEEDKENALALLIKNTPEFYGIIFAQTKKQVSELEIKLRSLGLKVDSLHGDKVQAERTRVISRMKKRDLQILVATDVAARGLDIEDLTHVVNFEIPWEVETYTHRIGRTARAGKTGIVWTLVKPKEAVRLRKFEKSLRFQFKNLEIPSVQSVRQNQIVEWYKQVSSTVVPPREIEDLSKLFSKLELEGLVPPSNETQEWLLKVIRHMKVANEVTSKQPRNLQLRSDSIEMNRDRRDDRDRQDDRQNNNRRGRYERRDNRDRQDDRPQARSSVREMARDSRSRRGGSARSGGGSTRGIAHRI